MPPVYFECFEYPRFVASRIIDDGLPSRESEHTTRREHNRRPMTGRFLKTGGNASRIIDNGLPSQESEHSEALEYNWRTTKTQRCIYSC